MQRRTLSTRAGGRVVAAVGLAGAATADEHEENPTPVGGTTPYDATVRELRYPLTGKRVIVHDDHPVGLDGRELVSANASDPAIEGATVVRSRTDGRRTGPLVAYEVADDGTATIRLDE